MRPKNSETRQDNIYLESLYHFWCQKKPLSLEGMGPAGGEGFDGIKKLGWERGEEGKAEEGWIWED